MTNLTPDNIAEITGYLMEDGGSYEDVVIYIKSLIVENKTPEQSAKAYIQRMLALNLIEEKGGEFFPTKAGLDAYYAQTLPKTL